MRDAVWELVADHLAAGCVVRAEASAHQALEERGFATTGLFSAATADACVLLEGEFGAAGEHAESLLSDVVEGLRPGGRIVAVFTNALIDDGSSRGTPVPRRWRPADVAGFLGARGVRLEGLWGLGAHARISGAPPVFDPRYDAEPSIVGAAPTLLALAAAPSSSAERSAVFFATLPAKTIAAATLTRGPGSKDDVPAGLDEDSLLIVHDSFKQRWTIPGGVVDADEDPQQAAIRETREEAGIDVTITGLLGVFHGLGPDRLVFLFGAEPLPWRSLADAAGGTSPGAMTSQDPGPSRGPETSQALGEIPEDARAMTGRNPPAPIHTHEIDGVAWVDVDEALRRVAPHTAEQIRKGLDEPGGMWRQY